MDVRSLVSKCGSQITSLVAGESMKVRRILNDISEEHYPIDIIIGTLWSQAIAKWVVRCYSLLVKDSKAQVHLPAIIMRSVGWRPRYSGNVIGQSAPG